MRGRKLKIEWRHDAVTSRQLYRAEREVEVRTRWHALWLVREGYPVTQVARLVGVHVRTVQQWLAWYRQGGVAPVREHRHGGRQGRPARLTAEERSRLVEEAKRGTVATIGVAVAWVEEQFGVTYSYWGMRSLFERLRLTKKVPRPIAPKASLEAQEAWKRGG